MWTGYQKPFIDVRSDRFSQAQVGIAEEFFGSIFSKQIGQTCGEQSLQCLCKGIKLYFAL